MPKRRPLIPAGFLVLALLVISGGQGIGQDLSQAGRYVPPRPGTEASYKFVASRNSREYHWPVCKLAKAIKPEDRITFRSAKEAQAAGYVHCKVCSKFRF
jgi:hypothetical protein